MDRNDESMRSHGALRRTAGDAGAAMVELALVMLLLSMFVFGIISFGYLFSFRQNMTQAAAEGARAGAVAVSGQANTQATTAVADAVQSSFGRACSSGGLTCDICVTGFVTCSIPVAERQACLTNAALPCITVKLTYDYANHPLLPDPPLISLFMPSTISVSSTARVS